MVAHSHSPSAKPLSRQKILVVEDDRVSMEWICVSLEQAGYDIDTAVNGSEALQKMKAHPDFSLVITDRIMPEMDGIAFSSTIRNDPQLHSIPVIMQSGAQEPHQIIEGVKTGVYYYLNKPYEKEALLALVKSALRDCRQRDTLAQKLKQHDAALDNFQRGDFAIQTPEEAETLSFMLGSMFHNPAQAIPGLYELMLNAVEHGNLDVGFQEKNNLLEKGGWKMEVKRRLKLPENKNKFVQVSFSREEGAISVSISDTGTGFNWKQYLEIDPSRATKGNGRGIAKASLLSFEKIEYKGKGNQVVVTGRL